MERQGESKVGKVSLILSLSVVTFMVLRSLIWFLIPSLAYNSVYAFLSGLFLFFEIIASLVSFSLGLAGIFQKTRVRKSAFIGTTISSAILIIYVFGISILIFTLFSL